MPATASLAALLAAADKGGGGMQGLRSLRRTALASSGGGGAQQRPQRGRGWLKKKQRQRWCGVCEADKKTSTGRQMVWKEGKLEAEDIDYQELDELLEGGLDWDVEEQLRFSEELQPEEPDDLWDSFDANEQAAIAHILDMSGVTQSGSLQSKSTRSPGEPTVEDIERMGDEFLRRLDLDETVAIKPDKASARNLISEAASPKETIAAVDPPFFRDVPQPKQPESSAKPTSKIREAIQLSKMDFTVNSLLDKVKRNKLDLRPSYQREYVWTARNASKLIESLVLNVPIPTLFFNETGDGKLEVVDGKQRLTSIHSFVSGKFPNGQPFELSGLEVLPNLNGKTFMGLSEDQREQILDYPLNIHTLSRHNDNDYVFEVFERLNMGATQLNEMELRNCIYHGTYNFILHKLASTPQMMEIMQSDSLHSRMKDRELILRFFALLRSSPEGFKNPIKKFLNEEIRLHRHLSTEEMEQMCKVFIRAADCALCTIGPMGFRVKSSSEVNPALFEMILYCFAPYDSSDVKPYASEIDEALKSFNKTDGKNLLVASPRAVSKRIRLWGQTVDSVLSSASGGDDGDKAPKVKKRGLGLFGM